LLLALFLLLFLILRSTFGSHPSSS
jgi:hypothetical protein